MRWGQVSVIRTATGAERKVDAVDRFSALDFVEQELRATVPGIDAGAALAYDRLFDLQLFREPGYQRLSLPELGMSVVSRIRDWTISDQRAAA